MGLPNTIAEKEVSIMRNTQPAGKKTFINMSFLFFLIKRTVKQVIHKSRAVVGFARKDRKTPAAMKAQDVLCLIFFSSKRIKPAPYKNTPVAFKRL